jgi:hypothetical protein
MAITSFTPNKGYGVLSGPNLPLVTVTTFASDSAVTPAQVLGGLIIDTEAGAASFTLPTATELNAAINGPVVGTAIDFALRNTGNNTATLVVGTGITSASGNTLTVATLSTRHFKLVCTGVLSASVEGSSNTYALYSMGVSLH